jgi:MFS family permease
MSEAIPVRTTLEPEPPRDSAGRARVQLLVVGTGALLVSLSQSVLVPVLAILPQRLHTSTSNVEWLLTSTFLVGAVAVPLFGRLGDMFGKRRLLLVALATLAVGSLLDALTSNVALLIVGRAIQGASLAAIPLGISLLSSLLPRERVRSAIALISAMLGVGGALGLPLAGLVAERSNFHVLFWITAIGGALSLIATVAIVPVDTARAGGRVDIPGAVLMAAALVALLLPLAEGGSWGWTSVRTLGLLAAAVILFAAFVVLERRVSQPLVDLKATSRRPIVLTNLASLLFGFALFASLIGTASFVQAPAIAGYGFGSSIVVAGLTLLPSGLLMLLFAPVAARLIGSIGANRTLSLGAVIVAAGWLERIFATGSLWEVIVGAAIIGVGVGIGYAAMPALINANTPCAELAAANGLNSLARSLGSSLASAIGGSLLTLSVVVVGGAALPSLAAYRSLFATCAAVAVLAAVAALFVPHDPGAAEPAAA